MRTFHRTTVFTATVFLSAFCGLADDRSSDASLLGAVQRSDLPAVERAIAAGANVNSVDKFGTTPLMQAALYSNASCIRLLLDKGADPNAANQAGATALMWSAGDPEKVRLLLNKKSAVNPQASSGRTALSIAASNAGNIEAVELLLAAGAKVKVTAPLSGGPVWAAASSGDAAILRAMLSAGGDPNERNRVGMTPLMEAVKKGSIASARLLLDAGAEVNVHSGMPPVSTRGLAELGEFTPLILAGGGSNARMVRLLLDHGADVHAKESRGMNALTMAAASEYQDEKTVRILIEAGSDIQTKANDGQTAAIWASKWGNTGVLKLLAQPSIAPALFEPAKLLDVPRHANIRDAVEKTIALLQASSSQYFQRSGCSGCHHQMLTGMAVGLARDRGLKVNQELAIQQLREVIAVRTPDREGLLQGLSRGGAPMGDSLLLLSVAAQGYPADALTTALTHAIAGMQMEDGSWHAASVRQPLQYSGISDTVYAIRALQLYGPEGRKPEFARRIERARAWLLAQKPKHNEDRVKRLLGLKWAGADAEAVRAAGSQLLADQQQDGGWAQRSGFSSDAYATGQTLYALNVAADIPSTTPAYLRGVSFLRRSQLQDGSWLVRSRSVKFQPYFESGFPHGHDQWISAAGSAWAAMALTLAAERPALAAR